MSVAYYCPACKQPQALYANVAAPGPDRSVYVTCPDCQAVAVHHPHPCQVESLREWARRVVAVDVEVVCAAVRQGTV